MNLNIEISPSEKKIVEIIGKDKWNELRRKTIDFQPNKCVCCNYPEPENGFKRINLNPKLNVHVLPYSPDLDLENDYDKLNTVILCDACHALKHFDVAVKNNWVKLANSSFSQLNLILACRWGNKLINAHILGGHKVEKMIFPLKKTPESYLEEIQESKLNVNPKIKVIFTKNFDWTNCR